MQLGAHQWHQGTHRSPAGEPGGAPLGPLLQLQVRATVQPAARGWVRFTPSACTRSRAGATPLTAGAQEQARSDFVSASNIFHTEATLQETNEASKC